MGKLIRFTKSPQSLAARMRLAALNPDIPEAERRLWEATISEDEVAIAAALKAIAEAPTPASNVDTRAPNLTDKKNPPSAEDGPLQDQ